MGELECNCNYIIDTVERIDRMQKRVSVDDETICTFCETSLFSTLNNTIPVSFSTRSGDPVTGNIGNTGLTTTYFRIESLRCKRYVTLRLLQATTVGEEVTLVATPYTMILDLDFVITMQCYDPISVTLCNQSINN